MPTFRHVWWRAHAIAILTVALLIGAEIPTLAQSRPAPITEVRALEIYGQIGRFRAASDEGDIGTAPSYSAVMVAPFSARFVAEVDVQTSRVATTQFLFVDKVLFEYVTRRILIIPSLIYRFGGENVYGLVGGGVGVEFDDNTTRVGAPLSLPGDREVTPGIFERSRLDTNWTPSFRAGVVAFSTRRFGIRGDVYLASYSVGARIGVGYRFR